MDRRWSIALIASVAGAAACTKTPEAAPSIDGTWTIAAATLGGKSLPVAALAGTMELVGGRYAFQNDTGVYTITPAAVPAAIDIRGVHGPNAGKTIPAIFRMDHDTLEICYDLSGQARPKGFTSDGGTELFLVHYTHAKG